MTGKRIAVAMSGGVDSSLAAALLVQDDYDVIGLTMQLFDRDMGGDDYPERGCCNLDAVHRAEAVCHSLDIPHYTLDLRADFKKYIIDDFIDEYISGRTPNPCVRCNAFLKWGSLFRKAEMLACNLLATGHYARLEKVGSEYYLLRAADLGKDQVYALWGIPADKLSKTKFPLGELRKEQVRRIAADLGLKSAYTPESQEICFIPSDNYADFLRQKRPDFFAELETGELWEETADTAHRIGKHAGYPFYTVGQRKGLGGGFPAPRYVLRVDATHNRVVIGDKSRLAKRRFTVDQVNWLIPELTEELRAQVQVRYRSQAHSATIRIYEHDILDSPLQVQVEYDEPVEAICPGQSAVFFQGERLIGGGRIIDIQG